MIKSIKNVNVKGKKVLLRVDFNVPVEKGKILDDFDIIKTLPTINFLKKKGAKIILISHTSKKGGTLRPMAKYLKIRFVPALKLGNLKNGEVVLLENIRNFKGEESNDPEFAKKLAGLGDIFVNEAFGVSHRKHASIIGIPKYLPSYMGLLFENELKSLEKIFKPSHPFLLILGGIKFESKLGVLEKFINVADKIFIGGALSNNFFRAQGINIGRSFYEPEVNIKKYLKSPKIILPIDLKTKNGMILDMGQGTINSLLKLIKEAKFILWNGPLGDYEKSGFEKGTLEIARAIARSSAQSIIGGGDTVAAIRKFNIPLGKFSFVSTAGGALLEFLARGTLPGIKALK
jgi:phosphoglycerate kinase